MFPFAGRLGILRAALAIVPATMLSLAVPLVNHIEPRILGMPFIMAWVAGWLLLTPAFLFAIYRLEGRK